MLKQVSRSIVVWDIIIAVLATYAAIEIPYGMVVHFTPSLFIVVLNRLVTVCFILDIFIRFRNLSIRAGVSKKERKYPAGWLTIDVLAAIPFELFLAFFGSN